jgi:cAMP-dependent protein kinase regulator
VIPKSQAEKDSIREVVGKNFLFANLAENQLQVVLDAVDKREHKAGDFVIKQGEEGNEFFILASGECDCFVEGVGKVKEYIPGESFGELSLMYMTPRAASIQAKTDCVCWVMDRLTFRKVVLSSTQEKREKYEGFLNKVELLQSLDKYERAALADALTEKSFKKGEFIITEGAEDTEFYILEFGTAIATKALNPGEAPSTVMNYEPGDYFGELALITSAPRAANVVADSDDCVVVSLSKDAFNRLIGSAKEVLKRDKANYAQIEQKLKAKKLTMDKSMMQTKESTDADEVV